ncbi:hypothetical protein BG011_004567 [Mortierella polycephala]|uniref:beta-N-acetylhexosaminidase n=1 Tax=Mortierella polycephala TaxID=41804 RepID=A0A9P6QCT8_9FUNG|nr:hypothetical protein BG011_004567 [Mortierella polycephala]
MAKVDQSQMRKTSLDSVEVNVEDSGTETLRLEIDGSYRPSITLNKGLDVRFGINEEHCARILQGCPLQDKVKGIIMAKTVYGSLHDLGTLARPITSSHDNPMEDVCNPNLIHDRPLIPRRGFMLDNSSSYLSMTSLYRTIDTMTLSKFDVFHRHNANSQRFPSVMDDEPDMVSEKKTTAFSAISVCLDGYPSYGRFSAEPPNGQRNQVGPKTHKGIQGVSDQVLLLLKDEYVHAGADVANLKCWNEIAPPWEVPLPDHILEDNKDTLIQNWKISRDIKKVIQRGYKMISGSANYGYLDRGSVDRLDNWSLSRSWRGPYKSSQKIYSFNPLTGLDYAETEKVLGGQHALAWGEQPENANLDVFCSYPSK